MIKIYQHQQGNLVELPDVVPNTWINIAEPSPSEIATICQKLPWIEEFINDPLDIDEKARIERDNELLFTLVRIPVFQGKKEEAPFITIPLGIIIYQEYIVTICKDQNVILQDFERNTVKGFSQGKRYRFLLLLLFRIAAKYLKHLREINRYVEKIEDALHSFMRNEDLIELLKYQKALVYYATALKSNQLMLKKLSRMEVFKQYEEDEELLEDVDIEFQQAIEMTNIASNILTQMTSSYASIINNNMNIVIKTLTLITIVLYIPTLIASFYGMNVPVPGADNPYSFVFILFISLLFCALVVFIFIRRKWF